MQSTSDVRELGRESYSRSPDESHIYLMIAVVFVT